MDQEEPLIRNISDTAIWVAMYRAQETEREDAHFRDPFAKRLAGERGKQIIASKTYGPHFSWPMVTRTVLFDNFITEEIKQGVDLVVNLAAGLDTRPYRMALPPALKWIEVDLPPLLAYKEEILKNEKPVCMLERIPMDLSNRAARGELFARLGSMGTKVLIISEGLLVYLPAEEVASLAQDLAAIATFRRWLFDLASPGLLKMLQKQIGADLTRANSQMKFGPREGPSYFEQYGWKAVTVHSIFKKASKLHRLPFFFQLMSYLPERPEPWKSNQPWSGICLFERK